MKLSINREDVDRMWAVGGKFRDLKEKCKSTNKYGQCYGTWFKYQKKKKEKKKSMFMVNLGNVYNQEWGSFTQ